METTYWHRQTDKALFPELEWNKPERRDQAGKVLVVGGDMHNLAAPASAFEILKQTGVGNIKLALPDKTKKFVGKTLPEALFLPSTTSGEFSIDGEVELLDQAMWADALLLPGDNGRNSQTTILFSDILQAYKDQITLTRDAVDILSNNPAELFEREHTTLIVSFAQLQKLMKNYGESTPLTFVMDLVKFVEFLHVFTQHKAVSIVTLHQNQLVVASRGKVSTTKSQMNEKAQWRLKAAVNSICYQVWNPERSFEALTHACFEVTKSA